MGQTVSIWIVSAGVRIGSNILISGNNVYLRVWVFLNHLSAAIVCDGTPFSKSGKFYAECAPRYSELEEASHYFFQIWHYNLSWGTNAAVVWFEVSQSSVSPLLN